jgi:hypothetical protein
MTLKGRDGLLLLGAIILIATAFLTPPRRHAHTEAPTSSASGRASASAAPEKPPALTPAQTFVFDCAEFTPPIASACSAAPDAETAFLDLVNSYRVSALPCGTWWQTQLENATVELQSLAKLDPKQLPAVDRALIQNAALELLSCTSGHGAAAKSEMAPKNAAFSASARALIKNFALSAEEITALPMSTPELTPWLGDSANWQRGKGTSFLHTASEGYARAHQQLQQTTTVADVVRLVLVNQAGAPFVSDVVQRVAMRRREADGTHVCIAELAPAPTNCGPATLHALDPERGAAAVKSAAPPDCAGCHFDNTPRSAPFGPETGFQVSDASVARIKAWLKPLLQH